MIKLAGTFYEYVKTGRGGILFDAVYAEVVPKFSSLTKAARFAGPTAWDFTGLHWYAVDYSHEKSSTVQNHRHYLRQPRLIRAATGEATNLFKV
jgi:hypothetical protein